ncbi:unnamed protein product [Prunus brigantina]
MVILFRDDAEAPLCYQSSTSLALHTWNSVVKCFFQGTELTRRGLVFTMQSFCPSNPLSEMRTFWLLLCVSEILPATLLTSA